MRSERKGFDMDTVVPEGIMVDAYFAAIRRGESARQARVDASVIGRELEAAERIGNDFGHLEA